MEQSDNAIDATHDSKLLQGVTSSDAQLRTQSATSKITQNLSSSGIRVSDHKNSSTMTCSKGLMNVSASRSAISSPRDFNRNPYTEAGYTPKRFRPEEYERESSSDEEIFKSTMSSSCAWLPPEDPDEVLKKDVDPISPTAFSRSANEYTGAVLQPGQLSSITTYGFPGGAFTPQKNRIPVAGRTSSKGSPTHSKSHQRQSEVLIPESEDPLDLKAYRISPESSSAGTQTNSGAPLSQSNTISTSFAIRAQKAGIADWNEKVTKGLRGNDSVFDGRWVLYPDEAWNVPARPTSVMTTSPDRPSVGLESTDETDLGSDTISINKSHKMAHILDEDKLKSDGCDADRVQAEKASESMNRQVCTTRGSGSVNSQVCTTQANAYKEAPKIDQNKSLGSTDLEDLERYWQRSMKIESVPEAPESVRFAQYVTDLSLANDGLQGKLESYDPASIRRVFYLRVFEDEDPQAPHGEEAEKPVKDHGRAVTYRELHFNLLQEIDDLVAHMTTPQIQKPLRKLVHNRDALRQRRYEATKTPEGGPIQVIGHSASRPPGAHGPKNELQYVSRGQPLHQEMQKPAFNAEARRPDEQIEGVVKPSTSGSTYAISAVMDPQSCNIATGGDVDIDNNHFRSPPGFGDPATANFKPIVPFDNDTFTPILESGLLEHDVGSLLDFSAPGSRTNQPFRENVPAEILLADQESGENPPFLMESNNPTTSIAPDTSRTYPFSGVVTAMPGPNVVPQGMLHTFPGFGDQAGHSIQDRNFGAPAFYVDAHNHNLHETVFGSRVQAGLPDVTPHVLHPQPFSQGHAQQHAPALRQAQRLTRPGVQAQPQISVQYQHNADVRDQLYGRHDQQVRPSDFLISAQHTLRHQNRGYVTGYQTPMHAFTAPSQTLGMQSYAPTDVAPDGWRRTAGLYQQWVPQPTPPSYIPQQRPFSDMHSNERLLGTGYHVPYMYGLVNGLQAYTQRTTGPSSLTHGYSQPYIPPNKYARAPAPNRIASRLAQFNDLQLAPSKMPISNSAVQTRYPTPVQNQRTNLATLPYRAGSDNMFPIQIPSVASIQYQDLTRDEPPRFAVVGDDNYIPFLETTKLSRPAEWGVLKISNIPYDITRELIHNFLGPHAKLITPDLGPSIHIMMDRATGKTQDCYVEFFSVPDARAWHSVIVRRGPHLNKIGDRILEVELSSQEELLKELFPRARCVIWKGANGIHIKETEEAFDSGFKGFITQEELKGLIHHAEQPHRSLYTQKCPPRPYTNMISILAKFPWHATQYYTLSTRNTLFAATITLIKTLSSHLRRSPSSSSYSGMSQSKHLGHNAHHHHYNTSHDSNISGGDVNLFRPDLSATEMSRLEMRDKGLNETFLRELVLAGMNAHGFSDRQRWELFMAAAGVLGREWIRLSSFMGRWPFETLGRKSAWEEDVVEFYALLISSHPSLTLSSPYGSSPATSTNINSPGQNLTSPGGDAHRLSHQRRQSQQQGQQQQTQAALASRHHRRTSTSLSMSLSMPFGRFDTQLYETSIEGYREQTVTMKALTEWEMGVIGNILRGLCV